MAPDGECRIGSTVGIIGSAAGSTNRRGTQAKLSRQYDGILHPIAVISTTVATSNSCGNQSSNIAYPVVL